MWRNHSALKLDNLTFIHKEQYKLFNILPPQIYLYFFP